MTEIKHLQKVILSIAEYIDILCRKNGIEYYLLGGSAIGAIRHKGFIPWDDDLDIIMTHDNYKRFIQVCREQLDHEKYQLQEGLEDWPLYFSKIRLKGTYLNEFEGYGNDDTNGIYIDVFKMDNVSGNNKEAYWQYFCGKLFLCYQLSQRSYKSAGLKKKLMMYLSVPLRISFIRNFVIRQIEKYNDKSDSPYLGFFYGRTKYKSAVIERSLFGKPHYVDFENIKLPVPEKYHEYLTQVFGDYMKLPPVEQRVGLHLISVDFGKY